MPSATIPSRRNAANRWLCLSSRHVPLRAHLAALFTAAFFVSACEVDPVADIVPQAPPIVVVDRDAFYLCLDTIETVSAELLGDSLPANRAVHFATLDSTVVAIFQQSGRAAEFMGVSSGVAVVVARAVADSMLRASSQVTVLQCESPPPTIAIISITLSGTSTRVDTANVTGRIDIHFAVDLMPADTVPRLRVGGGSGPMHDCPPIDAATQTGVCTLDSAANDGRGALIHANGPQPVSVRMVRPDGTTIASEE